MLLALNQHVLSGCSRWSLNKNCWWDGGEFEKQNPDVKVNAIYVGNYNDARIKALAALKAKPAQLSVMFSIDIYELIEQDAIVRLMI